MQYVIYLYVQVGFCAPNHVYLFPGRFKRFPTILHFIFALHSVSRNQSVLAIPLLNVFFFFFKCLLAIRISSSVNCLFRLFFSAELFLNLKNSKHIHIYTKEIKLYFPFGTWSLVLSI